MLDTLTRTRTAPLIVALLHVHIAPPGSILMANGTRAHRTAALRAIVTGPHGDEAKITVGDFQVLQCSCDEKNCDHLRAYRFYL